MARKLYSEEEKSLVFLALTTHDGNVKRTTRDTGIPESTVRNWKKEWAEKGPSTEIAELASEKATEFVTNATRVRDRALAQLEAKLPDAKVSELVTTVGVLDDKIVRASVLARGKDETPAQIDARAAGEMLAGFVSAALQQAQERETAISTATENKQDRPALPAPS